MSNDSFHFSGEESIQCYVHSVSPVKTRGFSRYVNCMLQKESEVVKSVCFAVENGVSKSDPKHVDPKEIRVDPDRNS